MASPIDAAAASVLSANEVLLAAPGQMKLASFYPTPAECSSTIAQSVNNSGQLYVTSNSLGFGSSSNFQISSANLVDSPILNVQIQLPALAGDRLFGLSEDGWLFAMIRSIEISYSNSNLSNLILTSTAMRDWALSQCRDQETRQRLLKNAGEGGVLVIRSNVTETLFATLPLSFLNWESYSVENGFPFDARTLNGIIQIQINWNPSISYIMTTMNTTPAPAITPPLPIVTQFSKVYISMRTYQLMDSAFSVGNALAANPGMKYTIPAKWLNSYSYQQSVIRTPSPKDSALLFDTLSARLELTSAPAGMLQGIMIHCRPLTVKNELGVIQTFPAQAANAAWLPTPAGNSVNRMGGLRLRRILLQYSGQNIINLQNEEEIDAYMQFTYGDEMKTKVSTVWNTLSATDGSNPSLLVNGGYLVAGGGGYVFADNIASAPNVYGGSTQIEHQTYILPLMHEGGKVMRGRHFENLPQYSGSALTLELDMINQSTFYSDREPNQVAALGVPVGNWFLNDFGGKDADTDVPQLYGPMFLNTAAFPNRVQTAYPANYSYGDVEITVTYIIAALVQNSNGMVELQI